MKTKTLILLSLAAGSVLAGCASTSEQHVDYVAPKYQKKLTSCTYLGDVSGRFKLATDESKEAFQQRLFSALSQKALFDHSETNTLSYPKIKPKKNEKVFVTVQAYNCFK